MLKSSELAELIPVSDSLSQFPTYEWEDLLAAADATAKPDWWRLDMDDCELIDDIEVKNDEMEDFEEAVDDVDVGFMIRGIDRDMDKTDWFGFVTL